MAYEVTATRKRPQTFNKLVGQEFVVSTIENAIKTGRIAHAYLFSGPRGVGKTSAARLLAKALNCDNGPTSTPCGVCESCASITKGYSTDVIEIDGASNTSVNDIRVIKDEILYPPQNSRYKIYIIDEVHMLSNSAFNALLKTIEEPPEYIIFIFATTELQKVPATIRSRTQQFNFQLLDTTQLKDLLKEASEDMGIEADDDALFWIAKEATGSVRDAYTLFDQVASFSGAHITLELIKNKLGFVGIDQIASLVELAYLGKSDEVVIELDRILSTGVSIEQCIKDLTSFFRTLLLYTNGVSSEKVLNARVDEIPQALLGAFSSSQIEAALRTLFQTFREIRYSLNPRFEIELFLLRLVNLRYLKSSEEIVKDIASIKNDVLKGNLKVVKEAAAPVVITQAAVKVTETLPVRGDIVKEEVVETVTETPSMYDVVEETTVVTSSIDLDVLMSDSRIKSVPLLLMNLPSIDGIEENKEEGRVTIILSNTLSSSILEENKVLLKNVMSDLFYPISSLVIFFKKPEELVEEVDPELEKIRAMFKGEIVFPKGEK